MTMTMKKEEGRRDKKDGERKSWSSQAVFEMGASGAHAHQALVNEPSGARFFRGDWVKIRHCAHDHGAHLRVGRELTVPKCRFPHLVWREWRREELDLAHPQKSVGASAGV